MTPGLSGLNTAGSVNSIPKNGNGAAEAGLGWVGNQEFRFDHVKLEMPETTKRRAAQGAG